MLTIDALQKKYGKKEVVKDVSFSIQKGESFGLLGPNGAGKSTIISMISGLVSPDAGDVIVDGQSIRKYSLDVKKKIGIVPQEIALYQTMSAKDNLIFWGKLYGLKRHVAKKRAEEVLHFIGLTDRAKDKVETFSGGMKRRVNIGVALMHEPELLIMDEPTVGIDPQSRNHILETVKNLNAQGMTVIYTSHYMEEVEYLCDRIAVIDHGNLIAIGTKTELCNLLNENTAVQLVVNKVVDSFVEKIEELEHVERVAVNEENNEIVIYLSNNDMLLKQIVAISTDENVSILSLRVKEPNLETLFLQLTGRSLRD
ncbi:export ABC transporter ATP-binding protein [Bacillus solimangrovi]|uniref:Export ABC transporter ATP-binding protein n=1 Tax=Bacillus solimangrovi TaxID=1305675 RepID=A0A1E5LHP8_9BACI|nr:ABC transporter ATP-binding protein [Bacillus solimangrovi]OEH93576.1 export ABC transporter ATP-binding protein [Bacillus solimangrovi]